MRIKNVIYFSSNLKLEDLDLTDQGLVLAHFKERIEDYYLKPIKLLVDNEMAFAAGALECLLIDALERYSTTEDGSEARMVDWCQKVLKISKSTATNFYKFFRCGLLHEGHIKQFGQFCFDESYITTSMEEIQGFLVVNPKHLLTALEQHLTDFLSTLQSDAGIYQIFIDRLTKDFGDEVKKAHPIVVKP